MPAAEFVLEMHKLENGKILSLRRLETGPVSKKEIAGQADKAKLSVLVVINQTKSIIKIKLK